MTLRSSDLQSDSDLDSIRNSSMFLNRNPVKSSLACCTTFQDWEQFFESKANKSNGQHFSYREYQQDQNTYINGFFDITDIKHRK